MIVRRKKSLASITSTGSAKSAIQPSDSRTVTISAQPKLSSASPPTPSIDSVITEPKMR